MPFASDQQMVWSPHGFRCAQAVVTYLRLEISNEDTFTNILLKSLMVPYFNHDSSSVLIYNLQYVKYMGLARCHGWY